MLRGGKKPQLRRCAGCGKVGHNRSRCPDFVFADTTPPPIPVGQQPVKFFIHHVQDQHHHSQHIVNLKAHNSASWQGVQSNQPAQSKNPKYHFYHEPIEYTTPIISKPLAPPAQIVHTNSPPKIKPFKITKTPLWQKIKTIFKETENNLYTHIAETRRDFKRWIKQTFIFKRLATVVIILLLAAIVPTQARSYYQDLKFTTDKIAGNSTAGFLSLQESTSAIFQSQLPTAQNSLVDALGSFDTAVSEMQNNHQVLQKIASIVPLLSNEVKSRQNLITAGQKIALGNTYLLKGLSDSQANTNLTLTDRLAIILVHLKASLPNYEQALEDFKKVEIDSLPFEYQKDFEDFRTLFTSLVSDFKNLSALGSSLQEIFGGKGTRRYLLVFQNPYEIRPTGGFMGSFAIMDIKDGKILKIDVPPGGSYDLQGQLNEFVEPPSPLLLSNKRWEFQDSNWFPDFPTSADKMLWFYQHARDYTADGVIAINATVLERLLSIIGPIMDTKRGLSLTSENALTTIQQVVEEGPEKKEQKPKQILADLAPQFIEYFQNIQPSAAMPILVSLEEALTQKEIQAYFTDPATEATVQSLGWGGQILPNKEFQDYVLAVNANIQGQKSDAQIKQTIVHQAVVAEDGTITDTVLIRREHTGTAGEKLYGQTNIDFIRLYVPLGSELISAGGFTWPNESSFRAPETYYKKDLTLQQTEKELGFDRESGTRITSEFSKTVFGNWIITEPGETSEVQFTYKLPFKAMVVQNTNPTDGWKNIFITTENKLVRYQLIAQKQSGINSAFESQIVFPNSWEPIWREGENMKTASNGATITDVDLKKDLVWSLIMKSK